MLRYSIALLLTSLLVIGCTEDGDADTETPSDTATTLAAITTIADVATSTTALTTTTTTATTTPTTSPPTTTTTATTEVTTTTTLAPISDVAAGLFCRDLNALGYDYANAVTYWVRDGSPDRMDADRNGIPCETVYAEADVVAFWGSPLPTTTQTPSLTLAGLEAYVGEQWSGAGGYPIDWECQLEHGNRLSAGAVTTCRPEVIGDGEYSVLTALVLSDAGTVAVAQSGLVFTELIPDYLVDIVGSGKFCRDVLNPDVGLPEWLDDPELRYFGAVLYWFMEGRPDRMDADVNGIPCETLVDAGVVADFWDGGFLGETW